MLLSAKNDGSALESTGSPQAPVGEFGTLAGLRVLIADDEDSIRALYGKVFARSIANATIITARDGVEAVAQARAHQPDVIVMDLTMPGLDGMAANRALKDAAETARIPVIAFSGQEWDAAELAQADYAAFLTKPCNPHKLLTTVARVVQERGGVRSLR
jgi:CheY-like chemotaxis protein